MRKFSIAVAAVALAAGVTVAQATPNPHSLGPHGKSGLHPNKGKAGLHCVHTVGGFVRGTYLSAVPTTRNADGTYTGDLGITVTKVSKNARRTGLYPATPPGGAYTFTGLTNAKTVFGGIVDNPSAPDGKIDFADATVGNTIVHVLLKITKTRTSGKCGLLDGASRTASASRATFEYGPATVKRIIVHPPEAPEGTTGATGATGTTGATG